MTVSDTERRIAATYIGMKRDQRRPVHLKLVVMPRGPLRERSEPPITSVIHSAPDPVRNGAEFLDYRLNPVSGFSKRVTPPSAKQIGLWSRRVAP